MENQKLIHGELTGLIRQTAFEVHEYFGNGFLEKVYENALALRLRKRGIEVHQQVPLLVRDEDGTSVGTYATDLLVSGLVLVEVKAAKTLREEHTAQVLHYLKATGLQVGLLVNFSAYRFEMKRYVLSNRTGTWPALAP